MFILLFKICTIILVWFSRLFLGLSEQLQKFNLIRPISEIERLEQFRGSISISESARNFLRLFLVFVDYAIGTAWQSKSKRSR